MIRMLLISPHQKKKKKKRKRKTHAIMLMVFRGKYKDIIIFVFSLMVENNICGLFLHVLEIWNCIYQPGKKKTKTKKTLQAKIELMRERFLGSFSHVFH